MNCTRQLFLIIGACALVGQAAAGDPYPYSKVCAPLHLRPPTPPDHYIDAAQGIAERAPFEKRGLALHRERKWRASNCFLIHALNISAEHAAYLFNIVGFNFVAVGHDKKALEYFTDATAFGFDFELWMRYKRKPFFKDKLSKPIFRHHEESLIRYHEEMGAPD
ncbi:MAG: hypothetical protein P8009_00985 [Gammaproteobacteria bacterium]